jgi:hypothetical protein
MFGEAYSSPMLTHHVSLFVACRGHGWCDSRHVHHHTRAEVQHVEYAVRSLLRVFSAPYMHMLPYLLAGDMAGATVGTYIITRTLKCNLPHMQHEDY